MSISILNRGASGGMKPELTVIAPAGSTIDIMRNGIIFDAYTLGADETEHTFMVKVGTYTVRATLGTDSSSEEVGVDTVGQYIVEISYNLWLYREGDECEEVTGGWSINGYTHTWSKGVLTAATKNSDHIYMNPTTSTQISCLATNNAIDLTKYSKLCIDCEGANYDGFIELGVTTSKYRFIASEYSTSNYWGDGAERYARTVDISSINGARYFWMYSAADANRWAKAYKIWLE